MSINCPVWFGVSTDRQETRNQHADVCHWPIITGTR